MKQSSIIKTFYAFLFIALANNLKAIVIAKGNSTTTDVTFATSVVSEAYHTPTQTWYLGLTNNAATDGSEEYAICKVSHASPNHVPTFAKVGANTNVKGQYIEHLALSTLSTNATKPLVAFTAEADNAAHATTFKVVDDTGGSYAESAALEDSASAEAGKILKLVATPEYVFTAVKGSGLTTTNFGDGSGDGIAMTRINRDTTPTFTYYNTGDGTTAEPTALAINATAAGAVFGVTNDSVATTFLDMTYNDDLKRLYVSSIITGSGAADDAGFGVAIIKVDTATNILTVLAQCANKTTVLDSNNSIVGFESNAGVIALRKLRIMKTSTGFYYLIVNGQGSTDANTRNKVFAAALVSGNDSDLDGTFAKNDDLTTANFNTQATASGDIAADTTDQAKVGGGDLPIVSNDADIYVSDMKVIGDTVYVGISSDTTSTTNQAGIYYSQAILNNVGKVARWTDWAKAAPLNVGNTSTLTGVVAGSTKFIAVDAITCDVWGVETDGTRVRKTEWTQTGTGTTSLITKLNSSLSTGCFSAYDLNQSIDTFGDINQNQYAFFGGRGKVVFAKPSATATTLVGGTFIYPQTVTTDFSLAANYIETTISGDTAPITALGYSQGANGGNNGYFFAGNKNGLYAWAATTGGAGFDPANLADLDAAPFDGTFSWQKLTTVTGEVIKIVNTVNQVYVLTRDTSTTSAAIADKVYRIAPNTTFATLDAAVTLATSGTAPNLTTATLFFDIIPMMAAADATDDKLLLATNDGVYVSNAALEDDTTQTLAGWSQLSNPATDNIVYDMLRAPSHTRLPSMAWISKWKDDTNADLTYTRSSLTQLASNDTTTTVDMPNGIFNTDSSTLMTSLLRIKDFWSDGAKRIFIKIPEDSGGNTTQLYCIPHRIGPTDWDVLAEPGPLTDLALTTQDRFYWVQAIGATGTIFAGGNKGVVTLE